MCFQINKNYTGGLAEKDDENILVAGTMSSSPVEIADHVAVHESGAKNGLRNGQGSAMVDTAMAPRIQGDNQMSARTNLIEVVGRSVDRVLKNHKVKKKEKRMEIAMDVCDEILRFLDNPKNYKKKDE
ncbi:MAG TPA: hypothetical protein DG048_11225 [Pseudoalteromonas sp.]|nr:hypothetical protein [Pseudoalteromonas sp.]|tara:strand:- start:2368 stop:2751 length:384 start_codon:yes stop_codon:yes gene_type:complete